MARTSWDGPAALTLGCPVGWPNVCARWEWMLMLVMVLGACGRSVATSVLPSAHDLLAPMQAAIDPYTPLLTVGLPAPFVVGDRQLSLRAGVLTLTYPLGRQRTPKIPPQWAAILTIQHYPTIAARDAAYAAGRRVNVVPEAPLGLHPLGVDGYLKVEHTAVTDVVHEQRVLLFRQCAVVVTLRSGSAADGRTFGDMSFVQQRIVAQALDRLLAASCP